MDNPRVDIEYYMKDDVDLVIPKLVVRNSPLTLRKKEKNFGVYGLNSVNPILDGYFTCGEPDSELMTDPFHVKIQKSLGFSVNSTMLYSGCIVNAAKAAALKNIWSFFETQKIPAYMTISEETGEYILVTGYNPLTNVKISSCTKPTKTLAQLL